MSEALPTGTVVSDTPPTTRPLAAAAGLLRQDPAAFLGLVAILVLAAIAIFAPWLAPHDPTAQSVARALEGPSADYWLGTDDYGRDLLSRIIFGARPALLVGVCSVLVSMAIGVPLGMIAGFRLGWIDQVTGWLVDIMLSLPSLLLALMVVTLLGSSSTVLILAIGISHVPIFLRLARSSTMVLRNHEFINLARSFGATNFFIIRRHILPNVLGPIITMATLSIAGAIREEASLSFLGLGIQPPEPSWGNLIRDGVANFLEAPGLAVIPGAVLTIAVLAFNLVGDSLRDLLDPRNLTTPDKK
jgi:peptide/nickel transport system permease protein